MRTLLARRTLIYPGAARADFTSTLKLHFDESVLPIYRVLDANGHLVDNDYKVKLSDNTLVTMYKNMSLLYSMDTLFYDAQRQGRMSFYMLNRGEEGTQIGSAQALSMEDVIFLQYREAGVVMWRGFTLDEFASQLFSTDEDYGKGRQMPVHYGSNKLNIQTVSSPLGTQIPQAVGAAYALKREGKDACAVCYFGDGAASEGDFHAAVNFAATLDCPVIFLCRNNGIAISTPTEEQYRGDGIAGRGSAYGVHSIRVDGNDTIAVNDATRLAREFCIKENKPVIIESMSYRGSHHSTSDDSTRYRSKDEMSEWSETNNPLVRLRLYLESHDLWDSDQEADIAMESRKMVIRAMNKAEVAPKPPLECIVSDVYEEVPVHLAEQYEELQMHLDKYPGEYKLELYK